MQYRRPIFSHSQPAAARPQRRLLPFLGRVFRRVLMTLGALMLISLILMMIVSYKVADELGVDESPLPNQIVLYLPLEEDFAEHEDVALPRNLFPDARTMREIVDGLDRAAKDKHVKGLVAELRGGDLNIAHLEELRAALLRFRASGKFAYIYGTSYGAPGRGLGTYYLASAFDEIWLQPMGEISIAGIRAEVPFVRGALDKAGVKPQFFARKEYKNIFESAMQKQMSGPSRESLQGLIDDLAAYLTIGIAEARKIEPAKLKGLIDRGMFVDQQAVEAKLADRLDDYEALRERISMDVTGKPNPDDLFVELGHYAGKTRPPRARGPGVALVYLEGMISSGSAESEGVAAEDIADAISDAADDKRTRAIVLRIDSPGGTPEASETIRRAVTRAQAKGKKVIVSMGAMTASGGYWVAAPADRIFALPGTLTGSVGVAGGKVALNAMWEKLGVSWDSVQYGRNSDMWSFNEPFTESGVALMNNMMDVIYNGFVARVAEGRKMSVNEVEKVARGRVWSGRQAVQNGLVDELGGLDAALDYTAKMLGAKDRADLRLQILPKPVTPMEKIAGLFAMQARLGDDMQVLLQSIGLARASGGGPVTWEPVRVR
jgi:protease-4